MRRIAEIYNGRVVSVFDWDLQVNPAYSDRIAVDVTDVTPQPGDGWSYDSDLGTFDDTVLPESTPRIVSKFEFMMRFTASERVTILSASTSDPVVGQAIQLMSLADQVDLDLPVTAEMLGLLVSKSLLDSERVSEILA